MQLNAVSDRVVALLKDSQARTGLDMLKAVAEELAHPRPERVLEAGVGLLSDLAVRDVILGTVPEA